MLCTNYCHLFSFLKKSQNCNIINFCITSNLLHHKYNDNNFGKDNKKQASLPNQYPCATRKLISFWLIFKISYTPASAFFCFVLEAIKVFESETLFGFCWSVVRMLFFFTKDSILIVFEEINFHSSLTLSINFNMVIMIL